MPINRTGSDQNRSMRRLTISRRCSTSETLLFKRSNLSLISALISSSLASINFNYPLPSTVLFDIATFVVILPDGTRKLFANTRTETIGVAFTAMLEITLNLQPYSNSDLVTTNGASDVIILLPIVTSTL